MKADKADANAGYNAQRTHGNGENKAAASDIYIKL